MCHSAEAHRLACLRGGRQPWLPPCHHHWRQLRPSLRPHLQPRCPRATPPSRRCERSAASRSPAGAASNPSSTPGLPRSTLAPQAIAPSPSAATCLVETKVRWHHPGRTLSSERSISRRRLPTRPKQGRRGGGATVHSDTSCSSECCASSVASMPSFRGQGRQSAGRRQIRLVP